MSQRSLLPNASSRFSLAICLAAGWAACGPSVNGAVPRPDASVEESDAAAPESDAGGESDAAGLGPCSDPQNLAGCGCATPGAQRACYTGPAATRGQGLCHDGMQTCNAQGEFTAWGPCAGDLTPAAEVCTDGQDRSCDGRSGCDDPSCAGMMGCCTPDTSRSCYTGIAGTENVGACRPGMHTCLPDGSWPMACPGEVLPGAEAGSCQDSVDNDCNGQTDCRDPACFAEPACRPPVCQPNATQPCYTGRQGTAGVGACKSGTRTCDATGQWSPSCVGEVTPTSNEFGRCRDSVDNDCDGLTDCADFFDCIFDFTCSPNVCTAGAMQPCYEGPAGTQNVGPCRGGTQTCASDGKSWGPCMSQVLPVAEGGRCSDGVDNDCRNGIDCADPACSSAPSCCVPGGGGVDGTIWVHSPDDLYRVDAATWALTLVGSFNAAESMTDIAVTPSGDLYGISFSSLYSVNKTNGQATYLAGISGSGNNALTFMPNGDLLAADSAGDLKRINPATGAVTFIGSYANGYGSSGDMVAVSDGTMYGISATGAGGSDASSSNVLIRVDVATGAATAVGPIGFGSVWGLAYTGARVIAFTNGGQIIQVDPQTGQGTLLATKGVQFWGAGMSPLVPPSQCP